MRLSRHVIREYICKVDWATAGNICYLLSGTRKRRDYAVVAAELNSMCRTKRREIRLKKLRHDFYTRYALSLDPRPMLNHRYIDHDIKLRNCLAKYLNICGSDLIQYLTIKTHADALLKLTAGDLYFEFDSGHMGRGQLKEKIRNHYIGKGAFRVIFFTGTAEYAHWKNLATIKCLEKNRLNLIFQVARRTLKDKPNRLLGAAYHEYLEDGKLYNHKGRIVSTQNGNAGHSKEA